jgi:hypothetical protein
MLYSKTQRKTQRMQHDYNQQANAAMSGEYNSKQRRVNVVRGFQTRRGSAF